ncbi:hypothetical protein BGZ57DRAFT_861570 [Hyaloscypha finlandica]|nr:hypothetical protein BGZ57DRAFT_861570 [Hyaloscypha finlandica]
MRTVERASHRFAKKVEEAIRTLILPEKASTAEAARTRYSNEAKVRRSTKALVLRTAGVLSYKDFQEARAKRAAKDAAKEAKGNGKCIRKRKSATPEAEEATADKANRGRKRKSVVLEATNSELHHALKWSKKWRVFRPMRNHQNRPFLPLLDEHLCCDELSCLNVTAIPERLFLNV